jgi:hypothetical protein
MGNPTNEKGSTTLQRCFPLGFLAATALARPAGPCLDAPGPPRRTVTAFSPNWFRFARA